MDLFVPFILITTFAVLNLFIAIIVNSMQGAAHEDAVKGKAELHTLAGEIAHLRREIAALRGEQRTGG